MNITIQNTKSMISDVKKKLMTETDEEKRHKLATFGNQLNDSLLELQNSEPETKYCKYCNQEKKTIEFSMVHSVYVKKDGTKKVHVARRNKCNKCMSPHWNRSNNKGHKKDFNWLF